MYPFKHAVYVVAEPTYAGRVVKVAVVLVCLGILAPACGEPEPTIVYHFEVRGIGDNVKITYLTVEAGLVKTSATLPWASEEYPGHEGVRHPHRSQRASRVNAYVRGSLQANPWLVWRRRLRCGVPAGEPG